MGIASCPKKCCGKAGFPNQNISNHIFWTHPNLSGFLRQNPAKSLLNPLRSTGDGSKLPTLRPEVPPHSTLSSSLQALSNRRSSWWGQLWIRWGLCFSQNKWRDSNHQSDQIAMDPLTKLSPWQGERKVHASLPLNQKNSHYSRIVGSVINTNIYIYTSCLILTTTMFS